MTYLANPVILSNPIRSVSLLSSQVVRAHQSCQQEHGCQLNAECVGTEERNSDLLRMDRRTAYRSDVVTHEEVNEFHGQDAAEDRRSPPDTGL